MAAAALHFCDVGRDYERNKAAVDAALQRTLASGRVVLGPQVAALETQLAKRVGRRRCVALSSGTDALVVALKALGVGPGDEVLVPAFTWISTAEAVLLVGATPVFCDICGKTYLIDALTIPQLITPQTKAIIVVALFGQMANMKQLCGLARLRGLYVVEDAAQSFGASQDGAGPSCGVRGTQIAITSFFPTKPLGCYGDGGAAFTDDERIASTMEALRQHGRVAPDQHDFMGFNARLDAVHAGVLLVKLEQLDRTGNLRRRSADLYMHHLRAFGCDAVLDLPVLETDKVDLEGIRQTIQSELKAHGIPTAVYYKVLALPFHTYIEEEEIILVCRMLHETMLRLGYLQECVPGLVARYPLVHPEVKLAVVGCGGWGFNHVRTLHSLGRLQSVCDQDPTILQHIGTEFPGISTYQDYKELLSEKEVHGVVVAVPSDLHFEVASACLQAGAHVLVEKPLSLFLSDARELHRLAIESGRCLMVGHLLRFHPGVVKMLQLIRCKRIGNVQHIHCSRLSLGKWRRNENVLWSFAPHDISLCVAIVQAATNSTQAKLPLPDTISCSIHGTKTVEKEDVAHVNLVWSKIAQIVAHVHVSWMHPVKEHKTVVVGDKGMILLDDRQLDWDLKLQIFTNYYEQTGNMLQCKKAQAQSIPLGWNTKLPLELELQTFMSRIADCETRITEPHNEESSTQKGHDKGFVASSLDHSPADGHEGVYVVQVLEYCTASARENGKIVCTSGAQTDNCASPTRRNESKEIFPPSTPKVSSSGLERVTQSPLTKQWVKSWVHAWTKAQSPYRQDNQNEEQRLHIEGKDDTVDSKLPVDKIEHKLNEDDESISIAKSSSSTASGGAMIHPSSYLDSDVQVGEGTKIWYFCHLQDGCKIGANCVLGQNVNVGPGVSIGDRTKIQNNVSLCAGVTVASDVFIGPSVTFTNVVRPRAARSQHEFFSATTIEGGASIGANATIMCGCTLGAFCMIGAGSVVTKDVEPYAQVVGVPATRVAWVCECGEKLELQTEYDKGVSNELTPDDVVDISVEIKYSYVCPQCLLKFIMDSSTQKLTRSD